MKGVWISTIGALIAAAGAVVSSRQADKSKEEQLALSNKLVAKSEELDKKNDALLKATRESSEALLAKQQEVVAATQESAAKSEEIARLSQELTAYATGGNSYIHFSVVDFGKATQKVQIVHEGQYPVRNILVAIGDVTDQFGEAQNAPAPNQFTLDGVKRRDVSLDVIYPSDDRKLSVFPLEASPDRDTYAYLFLLECSTGRYEQIVHLSKVGDHWAQAYQVRHVVRGDRPKLVKVHCDPDYNPRGRRLVCSP